MIEASTVKSQILDVALRLFAQASFEGVAIGEIARQCGVSTPLIHYHFSSKLLLWQAAVLMGLQEVNRDLGNNEDYIDVDELARFKIFIRKYIGFVFRKPHIFTIITNERDMASNRFHWIMENIGSELYAVWTDHISALRARGLIGSSAPDHHIAQMIVGACTHFLVTRHRVLPLYDQDPHDPNLGRQHADLVIDVVVGGLLRRQ